MFFFVVFLFFNWKRWNPVVFVVFLVVFGVPSHYHRFSVMKCVIFVIYGPWGVECVIFEVVGAIWGLSCLIWKICGSIGAIQGLNCVIWDMWVYWGDPALWSMYSGLYLLFRRDLLLHVFLMRGGKLFWRPQLWFYVWGLVSKLSVLCCL